MAENVSGVAKAAGTPIEVTISGRSFKLGPLPIGDLAAIEQHIRAKRVEAFLTGATRAFLSIEEKASLLIPITIAEVSDVDIMTELNTLSGVCAAAYLMLRRYNENITKELVDELITIDNLSEVMMLINRYSGIGSDEESDKEEEEGESSDPKKEEKSESP